MGTEVLAGYVGGRLAKYKVPRHWRWWTNCRGDPNGKVRKRQLGQDPAAAEV